MSLTSQPAAYIDCYDLYARAADTPLGVRTPFATENAAKLFQLRMHKARAIQRETSRRIYPPTSPLHNTSEYDSLQVQIRSDGDEWWVYVRPAGERLEYVEQLDHEDVIPPVSIPSPTLQITHEQEPSES